MENWFCLLRILEKVPTQYTYGILSTYELEYKNVPTKSSMVKIGFHLIKLNRVRLVVRRVYLCLKCSVFCMSGNYSVDFE